MYLTNPSFPSCPRKDRIDKIKTPILFKENEGSTYLQPICLPYRLKVAYRETKFNKSV
jgi:hypothetical protein